MNGSLTISPDPHCLLVSAAAGRVKRNIVPRLGSLSTVILPA